MKKFTNVLLVMLLAGGLSQIAYADEGNEVPNGGDAVVCDDARESFGDTRHLQHRCCAHCHAPWVETGVLHLVTGTRCNTRSVTR